MSQISHRILGLSASLVKSTPATLLIFATAGVAPLLQAPVAEAAIKKVPFTAYRPVDGDRFVNVFFSYDDSTKISLPGSAGLTAIGGGVYGTLCAPPGSPPYVSGDCYVANADNLLPWSSIKPFTGYPIVGVTGQYWEKESSTGGFEIYNITGFAKVGSYEGGVLPPPGDPPAPRIPHFISDNLINPTVLDSLGQGGGLSQGGIVLLTDNPDYNYHLFTDPTAGDNFGLYAGCGSGTCREVASILPLPISFSVDGGAFNPLRDGNNAPLPNPTEGLFQPDPLHPVPNDVYALGTAPGGRGYATEGEIFQSSGQFTNPPLNSLLGLPPDKTNIDRMSSSLGLGACPGGPNFVGPFMPNPGALTSCPPPPGGPKGTFGLVPNDNVNSLSYGKDSGSILQFSVNPDAVGLIGTDVYEQSTLIANLTPLPPYPTNSDLKGVLTPIVNGDEAAGDIYISGPFPEFGSYVPEHIAFGHVLAPPRTKLNILYRDEVELGLQAPATLGTALGSPEDNLDAFEEADTGDIYWGVDFRGVGSTPPDGVPDGPAFFSLDKVSPSIGSATVAAGGVIPLFTNSQDTTVTADDILVAGIKPVGAPFKYGIYASGILDIGLVNGDILDALALSDVGVATIGPFKNRPNGLLDPGLDEALFSLQKGSPTLAAKLFSPGDVFYTDFKGSFSLYARHDQLGLRFNDELDALDIKPVPAPLPILGVGFAFGSIRTLRRLSNGLKAFSNGET